MVTGSGFVDRYCWWVCGFCWWSVVGGFGFVGFASGQWSLSLWVLLGRWSSIFFFYLFY